jgi:hypothetical protein
VEHATDWTARAMAQASGISLHSVRRIQSAHQLQPHRFCSFKCSNDLAFADKVEDIVILYMHPPMHTLMLSIDNKLYIQARDRTQPGLPLKPGKCGNMTRDDKRSGVTLLVAAFNVEDGSVQCCRMSQHQHQEFVRFRNAPDHVVSASKLIHGIADNDATHKRPNLQA